MSAAVEAVSSGTEEVKSSRSSGSTPPPLSLRGLLEKRSSDGSWKIQLFSLKRYKLYYQEPGGDRRDRVASLDLGNVVKVERAGPKLHLYVDEKRRHQLREVQSETSAGPTLDEWEDAILEHVDAARHHRAKKKHHHRPPVWKEDLGDDDEKTQKAAKNEEQKPHYRDLIVDFYQKTNPDKVNDVDTLIAKYKDIGVGEADLLAAIQNKYDKIRMLR
mmetsp:Transcript_1750/g.5890  ORF Transcript_1750/g.5890 Transcript_1750/m.5890 type:complete len:217 (-) Transcript_1750:203-853(-)